MLDMEIFDAMEEVFEEVTILEKPALFTFNKIEKNTIPKGYQMYEMRTSSDWGSDDIRIAWCFMENHLGTLITREKIELPADGELIVKPAGFEYNGGKRCTMKRFMRKHPQKEPLARGRGL